MGNYTEGVARARFEDHELVCMFQKVERFPEERRIVVKMLWDAFLIKKQVQALAVR